MDAVLLVRAFNVGRKAGPASINNKVASGGRDLFEQLVAVCLELHKPIDHPSLGPTG